MPMVAMDWAKWSVDSATCFRHVHLAFSVLTIKRKQAQNVRWNQHVYSSRHFEVATQTLAVMATADSTKVTKRCTRLLACVDCSTNVQLHCVNTSCVVRTVACRLRFCKLAEFLYFVTEIVDANPSLGMLRQFPLFTVRVGSTLHRKHRHGGGADPAQFPSRISLLPPIRANPSPSYHFPSYSFSSNLNFPCPAFSTIPFPYLSILCPILSRLSSFLSHSSSYPWNLVESGICRVRSKLPRKVYGCALTTCSFSFVASRDTLKVNIVHFSVELMQNPPDVW